MLRNLFLLLFSVFSVILPITIEAGYDKPTEKALKKRYKEVTYLAHSDCYMVMSKSDKGYYGICNSEGTEIITPTYKKIAFEQQDNGEPIIFAMNPNFKAASQGNIVFTLKRGQIIDFGRSEPQYIVGGFLTSYGKPIYNMAGNMVMDCEQTAVQPIRAGKEIKGYRISNRKIINNSAKDELIIAGPSFNKLFTLEGTGYLWKVDLDLSDNNLTKWRCTKNLGADDNLVLYYSFDGTPIDSPQQTAPTTIPKQDNTTIVAQAHLTKSNSVQPTKVTQPTTYATTQQTPKSDVDLNPPITSRIAEKTFAVIISNENYSEVEPVKFALNDGHVIAQYFEKTLGIPKNNIKHVSDATLNNIRKQINWLKQIADAFGTEAKIILYYSGHGVPDEKSKDAYLMPVDGYHSDMSTNYSINHLYEELASMNVDQITVFMDACFSGSQRGDNMLVAARGVKIKSRANAPKGKLVVFSAAQGDETAYPLSEKGHGMFTYYLLKKLKETGDKVTLGELSDYITTEVKRSSLIENGKIQTPSVSVSVEIEPGWENRLL